MYVRRFAYLFSIFIAFIAFPFAFRLYEKIGSMKNLVVNYLLLVTAICRGKVYVLYGKSNQGIQNSMESQKTILQNRLDC